MAASHSWELVNEDGQNSQNSTSQNETSQNTAEHMQSTTEHSQNVQDGNTVEEGSIVSMLNQINNSIAELRDAFDRQLFVSDTNRRLTTIEQTMAQLQARQPEVLYIARKTGQRFHTRQCCSGLRNAEAVDEITACKICCQHR